VEGGGQSPLLDGGYAPSTDEGELETSGLFLELLGAAEDTVEEKMVWKTPVLEYWAKT
jgi:hypothetical protein